MVSWNLTKVKLLAGSLISRLFLSPHFTTKFARASISEVISVISVSNTSLYMAGLISEAQRAVAVAVAVDYSLC